MWARWRRGESISEIGRALDRAPGTLHYTIRQHGGTGDRSFCVLSRRRRLRLAVAEKLAQEWSPEQISGWLVAAYPEDETMRVSPETIYRTLFIQTRGALKKELISHLRRVKSIRRPRAQGRHNRGQGRIIDAVSIRQRPAEVEDRAVPVPPLPMTCATLGLARHFLRCHRDTTPA